MKDKQKRPGKWFMTSGLLLLAAALLLTGYNVWDQWRAGVAAEKALFQLASEISVQPSPDVNQGSSVPDYVLNPNMDLPEKEIDGRDYVGTLELPSLNLSLPVLSQSNTGNLGVAPCRYEGTPYQSGFVIAGHNYRTHFGTLGSLQTGDQVYFTDLSGNRFVYHVAAVQTLGADDAEEMKSEEWDLTLFTCTYSGRNRFTVRCLAGES